MKKLVLGLMATAGLMMADSWQGTISDAKCGKAHADASEKSMKCVQGCVKGGGAPVFVVGDKVLKIKNADKVMDHLGHKVTVTGTLDGDTVTVESVKM
jgi:hypothetical protein